MESGKTRLLNFESGFVFRFYAFTAFVSRKKVDKSAYFLYTKGYERIFGKIRRCKNTEYFRL